MAEEWDELSGLFDRALSDSSMLELWRKVKAEGDSLKGKLETVEAHLNAVYKEKSILDKWTWSINSIAFDKLMRNLYKILEGS